MGTQIAGGLGQLIVLGKQLDISRGSRRLIVEDIEGISDRMKRSKRKWNTRRLMRLVESKNKEEKWVNRAKYKTARREDRGYSS